MKVDNTYIEISHSSGDFIKKTGLLESGKILNANKLMEKKRLKPDSLSVSENAVIRAIEQANKAAQGINTSFEFSIHEMTKQIMVKVMDRDTNEVIREIPPEKILDLLAKIWEMTGIIVDERR